METPVLTRRHLLSLAAATPAALLAARTLEPRRALAQTSTTPAGANYPHTLPPLPYAFDALEPHIDAQTMQIHHDRHHQTYVTNLNNALKDKPALQSMSAEDLIRNLDKLPDDVKNAVRNNGGGHVNHSMFWNIMKPQGGGQPNGPLADAIMKKFGSFDAMTTAFNDAGTKRFGSGWVWLAVDKNGLHIMDTPNQDNPMMVGHYPVIGNDVWEHAYYLKYQNRRADYLKAWWNVVNWDEANRRYSRSMTMNLK
jgi:Fe-Mn family superoxide dismutase